MRLNIEFCYYIICLCISGVSLSICIVFFLYFGWIFVGLGMCLVCESLYLVIFFFFFLNSFSLLVGKYTLELNEINYFRRKCLFCFPNQCVLYYLFLSVFSIWYVFGEMIKYMYISNEFYLLYLLCRGLNIKLRFRINWFLIIKQYSYVWHNYECVGIRISIMDVYLHGMACMAQHKYVVFGLNGLLLCCAFQFMCAYFVQRIEIE